MRATRSIAREYEQKYAHVLENIMKCDKLATAKSYASTALLRIQNDIGNRPVPKVPEVYIMNPECKVDYEFYGMVDE